MAVVTFDPTEFRTLYPRWADDTKYPDSMLTAAFDMAADLLGAGDNSPFPYDPAAGVYTRKLILDRATYEMKDEIGHKFASLVYEGKWFSPLREAEQAFIESTQKYVTGEVKFGLYKGNIIKAGTTSPYSLYNEDLASFKTGDLYDHHDAEGFITLFGLPDKVRALKLQSVEKK